MNRKIIYTLCFGAASLVPALALSHAQTNKPALETKPDLVNLNTLAERGKSLLEKARAGNGTAQITLENYVGHHTMLTVRTVSGGAEEHDHWNDFLIVLDGEGVERTGGTIVQRKEGAGGEVRGLKLEGAVEHPLHKGDVLHIPAGTPHQAIEAPGQSITILVIKVAVPQAEETK